MSAWMYIYTKNVKQNLAGIMYASTFTRKLPPLHCNPINYSVIH